MIKTISGDNVPQAYVEAIWAIRTRGVPEMSRNGPVLAMPGPTILEIHKPWERVLFHPTRDANPFFHVMEFVWMMAGSNDAVWIAQFNKRMLDYADDGIMRGAYGWRWSHPNNQVAEVIDLLKETPNTRQAIMSLWDPLYDGPRAKTSDRPCHTHVYFRAVGSTLDMTVCNRSNDLFWGMLGSNVVHFTMLHELISLAVGKKQGVYRVFSNNLHVYVRMPKYRQIMRDVEPYDHYKHDEMRHQPLLEQDETWEDFRADCYQLVDSGLDFGPPNTAWMADVGIPIYEAYLNKQNREHFIQSIGAPDWHRACKEWSTRRR